MRCILARHFIWISLLLASESGAVRIQDLEPAPVLKRQEDGYYASAGVGFANLDAQGVGVRVPLGFKMVSNRLRLIGSANLFDLSFLEGDDRDPRYFRPYVNSTLCVDSLTQYRVPSYRCSGGTKMLVSASADLAYIIIDEVWIVDQPGKFFAGLGYRHVKPRTAYGTLGLFFDQPGRTVGGFKCVFGKGYIALGIIWAYDLRRIF